MRLKYLDVLKAFAIIAVVLYHSGFLNYGYLGVDLFFVINGYLITKSLNRKLLLDNVLIEKGEIQNSSKISDKNAPQKRLKFSIKFFLDFLISRLVRLMPTLLVAGVLCMVVAFFLMLPDDYENLSESVVATNFFGNNILAAITTKNYWAVVNDYKPLMHTWYVGVLMQFYIIYSIIYLLVRLDKKHMEQTLLIIISTLTVVSLLIYFGTTDSAQRFYYLPSRFYEFAVGSIVALTWKSHEGSVIFHKWFVYVCYALLIALMAVNKQTIEAEIVLVVVVALSVVMIMSSSVLENKFTANAILAKIGAASYSVFIWHQVLLAFYRYSYSSRFTMVSYLLFLLVTAFFSWITYQFIEKRTNEWIKGKRSKFVFYIVTITVWMGLTGFAGYIYLKGGVVRDVPELYISKNDKIDHKAYNDKIYELNKPFKTNKKHWLIIGNSTGRDFANVVLESSISNNVEVSYIYIDSLSIQNYSVRFSTADRVFLSSLGINEELVSRVETLCALNGMSLDRLVIVGEKNFGECNGQFYIKRNTSEYFNLRTNMQEGFYEKNLRLKSIYKDRFLDLISLSIDKDRKMPVFTPDHHYISQDCVHFSKGGAIWYSTLIDWEKFLR